MTDVVGDLAQRSCGRFSLCSPIADSPALSTTLSSSVRFTSPALLHAHCCAVLDRIDGDEPAAPWVVLAGPEIRQASVKGARNPRALPESDIRAGQSTASMRVWVTRFTARLLAYGRRAPDGTTRPGLPSHDRSTRQPPTIVPAIVPAIDAPPLRDEPPNFHASQADAYSVESPSTYLHMREGP
jgi:hypothetical protein